ncbi:F0F1 ATP synthase subunit gamma [Deferribacterales bacterium RsTz2092]|nr:ATP synthase gamma chain [Deferribacterales bacterium]
MASIKDIKRKISSVHSTQKITKAMKMVSAAKLRRANEAVTSTQSYSEKLREVVVNLAANVSDFKHPYMVVPSETKTVGLFVLSSDRGLCGAFNSNVVKAVQSFQQENPSYKIKLYISGKNAYDYFRRRNADIVCKWISLSGKVTYPHAEEISKTIAKAFTNGEIDAAYLIYNEFFSVSFQLPICRQLFPLSLDKDRVNEGYKLEFEMAYDYNVATDAGLSDFLIEPDPASVLGRLLPRYVTFSIYHSLLESAAGEHGARMVAMDNATRSADDMIKRLTLNYNKARQATITTELLDIVNGAEALR